MLSLWLTRELMCEVFRGTHLCPRGREDLEEELQRLKENTGAFAKPKVRPSLQALCRFPPVKTDRSSSTVGELPDSGIADSLNPRGPPPRPSPAARVCLRIF